MVATSAAPNRVAQYLNEPKKTLPSPPSTPKDREALLTDAVFAAVAALQELLTNSDPKVVMRAAEMILNLETTRQRHGRVMIGTEVPRELDPLPSLVPLPQPRPPAPSPRGRGGERAVNRADPFEVYVEQVREVLQEWEEGFPVVITRQEAREYAVELIDRERKRRAGEAVPPPDDPRLVPPAALVEGGSSRTFT